jgi:outer membrane protein assembly factor BamB
MVVKMKYKKHLRVLVPITVGLLVLFSVLALMLLRTTSDDWICFKGSCERTSSSDVAAPDTCFLEWVLETDSELYSSPVVKDGKVFQVALEKLYCLDLDTGDVLWISDIPVYQSTPFLADDSIVVTTNRGISSLSIESGEVKWEYVVSGRFRERPPLRDYIVSSPVVSDNRVVVGTMPYSYRESNPYAVPDEVFLVCVDEMRGEEQWYLETWYGVRTSPCVVDGKVFAASREMVCVDLETEDIVWNTYDEYPYDLGEPIDERYNFEDSTPAVYHGIVIAGSSAVQWKSAIHDYLKWQKIAFIDQYTGDVLWEWGEEGLMTSSPAVYQGKIYVYSFDGMVRCISLLEGEELWKTPISQPREIKLGEMSITAILWSSPTIADNKVYIGSIEGVFYCLDADTGEVLWMYETGGPIRSAPAVVQEKVLISSTDGKLYCFGIDPETYRMKAEHYIERKIYDKAEEFLLKAKEYAKTNEEIKEIDRKLNFVRSEISEYRKRQNRLAKAESLMDEADKILWDKKFSEAKQLYTKAYEIYTELNDEFGIRFCEERIAYIEKRISG